MIWAVLGIALAALAAFYLVKNIGYEGAYFEEFFVSVIFQAMFVGGVCLALYGLGVFRTEWLWVAVGGSFLMPLLGVILFKRPIWRRDRHKNRLYRAIRGGRKYKAFSQFVRENADLIGAIYDNGTVLYAPEGIPIFTKQDNGYEITTVWNPALGHPLFGGSDHIKHTQKWQAKSFFRIEEGERAWTWDEEPLLAQLIGESLPGGKEKWSHSYDDKAYYRVTPATVQKKKRRDPY